MFGGVGPGIRLDLDAGSQYITYTESGIDMGFGWNNQYYEFDINSCKFSVLLCGGYNYVLPA